MSDIYYLPRPVHTDDEFLPISSNGYLHFFEAGTTSYKAIYANVGLTVELANPYPIDSEGRAPVVFYGPGKYKVICTRLTDIFNPTPIYPDSYATFWQADQVDGNTDLNTAATTQVAYVSVNSGCRNIDTSKYTLAYSRGGYATGDAFGGWYMWVPSSTAADDGGWFFQPVGGGAGRWIRIPQGETEINLGIWALTPNSEILDSKFASASVIAESLNLPLRIPAGIFYWNGPVTTINTNCPVIFSRGLQFKTINVGNIHVYSPLTVESTDPIMHPSSGSSLTLEHSTQLQAIDARWYKSTFSAGYYANSVGLPVVLKVDTTLDAGTSTSFESGLIVDPGCATVTIPDDSVLSIGGQLVVNGVPRRIFTESDADPSTNRVFTPGSGVAQAWWWGWGFISGDDQTLALKRALKCSQASGVTLEVSGLSPSKGVYTDATAYANNVTPAAIRTVGGPIPVYTGGVVSRIRVANEADDHVFYMQGGVVSYLRNESVSPEWFGASKSGDNNEGFLLAAATSCARSPKAWLDGHGLSYVTKAPILWPSYSSTAYVKDIGIACSVDLGGLTSVVFPVGVTPFLERCTFSTDTTTDIAVAILGPSSPGYMNDCSVGSGHAVLEGSDLYLGDYVVRGLTMGIAGQALFLRNSSSTYSLTLENLSMQNASYVYLMPGQESALATIRNIRLQSPTMDMGNDTVGDIVFTTTRNNTCVQGVSIIDPVFTNVGEPGSDPNGYDHTLFLINSAGSGSWSNDSDRSRLVIKGAQVIPAALTSSPTWFVDARETQGTIKYIATLPDDPDNGVGIQSPNVRKVFVLGDSAPPTIRWEAHGNCTGCPTGVNGGTGRLYVSYLGASVSNSINYSGTHHYVYLQYYLRSTVGAPIQCLFTIDFSLYC